MRICNGPKLVVPRAGIFKRSRWGYWKSYGHGAHSYDEYLARERARIRALTSVSVAECKRPPTVVYRVKPGASFRLIDGHGRSYGIRFTAPCDLAAGNRVRLVNRQAEDYHALVSRMLKRAHRAALREDRHTL